MGLAGVPRLSSTSQRRLCPRLASRGGPPPPWTAARVIVFTEYEDTRRYLERCLREAIAHTRRADERIAVFAGLTPRPVREEIKHAFNAEPGELAREAETTPDLDMALRAMVEAWPAREKWLAA